MVLFFCHFIIYDLQGPTENRWGEWAPWINTITIIIIIIIIIIKYTLIMIRVSSRKELRYIELPMLWDLQIHSEVRDHSQQTNTVLNMLAPLHEWTQILTNDWFSVNLYCVSMSQ